MPVDKKDRNKKIAKVKKILSRTYLGDLVISRVTEALERMEKKGDLCFLDKGGYYFVDGQIKKSRLITAIKRGVMDSLYKGGIYKKGSLYICKDSDELDDELEDKEDEEEELYFK